MPDAPRPTLHLVRHGRSAHATGGWLDAAALRAWFAAYDAAGIALDDEPPAPLLALAREVRCLVASDLPRAVETAARLHPDGAAEHSPLLRELPVPIPALGPVRLPLPAWALVAGAAWAGRRLRGTPLPAGALAQADAAAAWLDGLARARGPVLAVTHASVRGAIAASLVRTGWRRAPEPRGLAAMRHWSAWRFEPTD